jgi:hypothetical protein
MALTEYQRRILALLASRRIAKQESYLARGVALIAATDSRRLSRDIDLFHDTKEALLATWEEDRRILSEDGYRVEVRLQFPAFVEGGRNIAELDQEVQIPDLRNPSGLCRGAKDIEVANAEPPAQRGDLVDLLT